VDRRAITGCEGDLGSRLMRAPASASAPMPALAGTEFAPFAAEFDTEGCAQIDGSPLRLAAAAPLSTFSIDVGAAS